MQRLTARNPGRVPTTVKVAYRRWSSAEGTAGCGWCPQSTTGPPPKPYDWKSSGPTVTVSLLERGLAGGAQYAAALRESATAVAATLPGPTGAVRVAQQGMPSTRDLAAALAARPVVAERPQRPALAPGSRAQEPSAASTAVPVER